MAEPQQQEKPIATNRKALFNYEILDRAEAGVALVGTEVKSIREGGAHQILRNLSEGPRCGDRCGQRERARDRTQVGEAHADCDRPARQ